MSKLTPDQMAKTVTRSSNGKRTCPAGGSVGSVKQAAMAKSSTLSLALHVLAAGSAMPEAFLAETMMVAALVETPVAGRFSASKWIQLDAEPTAVWDRPSGSLAGGSTLAMSLQ